MSKFALLALCGGLALFTACANAPLANSPHAEESPASASATTGNQPSPSLAWDAESEALETREFATLVDDYLLDASTEIPSVAALNGATVPLNHRQALEGKELFESGKALFAERKLGPARMALTRALHAWSLDAATSAECIELLKSINQELFPSTGDEGDMESYVVERGDSLARIAAEKNTTWQFLRRINGLDRTTIYVGQELKTPKERFSIVIKKDQFSLDLLYDGAFIKRYAIGAGDQQSTPSGSFTVMERKEHPEDNGHAFGTSEHTIGSHWLGLKGRRGYAGYGLHGIRPSQESRLGTTCTQGTFCLKNSEIEELFDLLPVGSQVTILA